MKASRMQPSSVSQRASSVTQRASSVTQRASSVVARRTRTRNHRGSAIAEFGAAFYAFCLAILIPTINFLAFAVSYSYSYMSANVMADTVSQAVSIKRARQIVDESADTVRADSLAKFLKVVPSQDAFTVDLMRTNLQGESVVVTNSSKNFATANSNSTLSETERNNSYFQYRVTANYTWRPMLDLGSVPGLNQIPIIGKESTLSFKLLRNLEHSEDF